MTRKAIKISSRKTCEHCGGSLRIRNSKGFCDHLYYPEYCEICSGPKPLWKQYWDYAFRNRPLVDEDFYA